jgi:transposase
MLWLVWAGCQWRALTRAWQMPWQSIYYYFRKWKNNALFEQLKDELLLARRLQEERKASPSAIAVDSQSVKVTSFVCEDTGIDGNKRHLAVDALGYPLALVVTGADVSDTEAGKTLADRVAAKLNDWSVRYQVPTRLALVRADAGYKNSFVDHVTQTYDWLVDIARGRPVKSQNR